MILDIKCSCGAKSNISLDNENNHYLENLEFLKEIYRTFHTEHQGDRRIYRSSVVPKQDKQDDGFISEEDMNLEELDNLLTDE